MIRFTSIIQKFGQHGDKTGWTYAIVPAEIAEKMKPGVKKSYRVKGKLDDYAIEGVSLVPMGGGDFIIPLNQKMRKGIAKALGEKLTLQLEPDEKEYKICGELIECLADEPVALQNFSKLAPSHQKYYSKWIESAKTEATKTKRIALTVNALARNMSYGEMLRAMRDNEKLKEGKNTI
jgi:hypothetical protein